MRIVNNKIYIARGETATYDVSVKDNKTGAPFTIPSGYKNPVIEFIVRPSVYDRKDDYVFKCYLDYASKLAEHDFGDTSVQDYDGETWDNNYTFIGANGESQPINALYRKQIVKGIDEYEYKYYTSNTKGDGHWVDYDFKITFQFPYDAMKLMEAKTYKYEVTLFDGVVSPTPSGDVKMPPDIGYSLTNIVYKYPLLESTDFIVGGSLSE